MNNSQARAAMDNFMKTAAHACIWGMQPSRAMDQAYRIMAQRNPQLGEFFCFSQPVNTAIHMAISDWMKQACRHVKSK